MRTCATCDQTDPNRAQPTHSTTVWPAIVCAFGMMPCAPTMRVCAHTPHPCVCVCTRPIHACVRAMGDGVRQSGCRCGRREGSLVHSLGADVAAVRPRTVKPDSVIGVSTTRSLPYFWTRPRVTCPNQPETHVWHPVCECAVLFPPLERCGGEWADRGSAAPCRLPDSRPPPRP